MISAHVMRVRNEGRSPFPQARRKAVDVEVFDVQADVERDAGAGGPVDRLALDDIPCPVKRRQSVSELDRPGEVHLGASVVHQGEATCEQRQARAVGERLCSGAEAVEVDADLPVPGGILEQPLPHGGRQFGRSPVEQDAGRPVIEPTENQLVEPWRTCNHSSTGRA